MILPSLILGGMERFVVDLTRELRFRGFDARIVCIAEAGPLEAEVMSERIPLAIVPSPGWGNVFRPRDLSDYFAIRQPDVVHTHTGAWNKGAWAANRSSNALVVHTAHGRNDGILGDLLDVGADLLTNRVIAVSAELESAISRRLPRNGRTLSTIENGIGAFSVKERNRARSILGVPQDAFVVGTIGRMVPVKDHRSLLLAFSMIAKARPDCFLAIVGDGPLRDELTLLAQELEISAVCSMPGAVVDARSLLSAFDVFCLSSLSEGTSIALLEALASGVPVVATAVGGNSEVLGATEMLVPPGDPPSLARALFRALTDADWRSSEQIRGRARVAERFSLSASVEKYSALYSELFE